MSDKSSYKHIFKSASLFGGVKIIQVISVIAKGKIIAIFLGTVGMGIYGLLVSSISIFQIIAGLGLNFSAIREISQAHETRDIYKLSRTTTVFFKWLLFSSIIGGLLLIIIAPLLSQFVFENRDYIWEFVFLSAVVVLNTLGLGYQSLLQGTRNLKYLAKTSILGSILSVVISLPIYYYWGISGIVPALIIAALTIFTLNYWFARKIKLEKVIVETKDIIKEGSEMAKLGVSMMITGLIGTLTTLFIISFIKKTGSLSDVGLYTAGLSITTTSLSLVFTAMEVDYFPRLSAINSDTKKVRILVNQQSEIMLLIITPLVIALLIFAPIIIRVFLSEEFDSLIIFIRFIAIGTLIQAANHSMGLISFAKGGKKVFLLLQIAGNISLFFFTILGYKIAGLNGIAAMFIIHAIVCYFLVYITVYKKYNYSMSRSFIKIVFVSIILALTACTLIMYDPDVISYVFITLLLCASIAYSIFKLDSLIGLKEIYFNFINRRQNKKY